MSGNMSNLSWSGEISEGWLNLTYLKNSETIMINVKNIEDITEELLQSNFDDILSDRDIMLAFKILFECMRNR